MEDNLQGISSGQSIRLDSLEAEYVTVVPRSKFWLVSNFADLMEGC